MATLHEMQTVYNLEDAFDMLEIITVDSTNEQLWMRHYEQRRG